eukprot:TRINITY_DN53475_c0_g1_i1.p1 TRINITY_DN53475_c0_g1~~TRINITY_DN53475_c0_g1_i1.p1  ORF type:complete len:172 (+),score=2.28 TRINITY_DN53475_c0_g1_i1:33-548(+)
MSTGKDNSCNYTVNVVSHDEWLKKRIELLEKEKELTKLQDEVTKQRLSLPCTKVDKEYIFEGHDNTNKTLNELFGNNTQLVVYHFMFDEEWDGGCKSCSFMQDHLNGAIPHLNAKNVSYALIAKASIEKLKLFTDKREWNNINVYSSNKSDFNYDYHVSRSEENKEKNESK